MMAVMVLGSIGLMIPALQPFLLSALVDAHRLTNADLGRVATLESLVLAVTCGVAPRMVARRTGPALIAVAAVVLGLVNIGTPQTTNIGAIYGMRAVAGLCEGVMVSAAIVGILQCSLPDRQNAIFLGVSALPQAAFAYLLPVVILPRYGALGGYLSVAAVTLLSLLFVTQLAFLQRGLTTHRERRAPWSVATIVILLGVLLQNAAIGGAWNYIEVLGTDFRVSADVIGVSAAGCLILQVVGAFLTAWRGGRLRHSSTLIAGAALQAALLVILAVGSSAATYAVSVLAFGFCGFRFPRSSCVFYCRRTRRNMPRRSCRALRCWG